MAHTLSPSTAAPGLNGVFTFDAVAHIYRVGGVIIPGVTDCLQESGLKDTRWGFHEAQLRGLHVHECCEYLDLHDLDWRSVYPAYVGYVRSWERLEEETGFEPELIEFQSYHPIYRFAGTMDRRGPMRKLLKDRRAELDIKTGEEEEWHKYQTAGYQILGGRDWMDDRRGCAYLQKDGSMPKIRWHDDPADLRVFLSAATITHIKRSLT